MTTRQFKLTRRRRRGIAEIEMLLCCLVLISILMLVMGGAKLGLARLNTVQEAGYKALGNASNGMVPLYTDDQALTDVTTEWDVVPGLPLHTHVVRTEVQSDIFVGDGQTLTQVKVNAMAGAVSPAWSYTAYPFGASDEGLTESWFEQFISESHESLQSPLMLAAPWAP